MQHLIAVTCLAAALFAAPVAAHDAAPPEGDPPATPQAVSPRGERRPTAGRGTSTARRKSTVRRTRAARPAVSAARPLIANGGFESGATGWRLSAGLHPVVDPTAARSGSVSLMGEVRRARQGRILRRTFDLRRDRLYRLVVWARASDGSRLTVWRRTAGVRHVVANWNAVSKGWRRYHIEFTVEADGPTTLGIVAPSSHGAPTGRMWLDDVGLWEQALVPEQAITAGDGFEDLVGAVRVGPSNAWATWLSYRDGGDTLQAAQLVARGGELEVARTFEVVSGLNILDPALVAGEGEAWLLFSGEREGNWDVYAVRLGAEPEAPVRITRDPGVDVRPTGALRDGTLWIAFETNRDGGRRQIWVTALGPLHAPVRLSAAAHNAYAPSMASPVGGPLRVAWHAFHDGNYDLYARSHLGDAWTAEQRLTRAPIIDREPRLVAHGPDLWLAWEQATFRGYRIGQTTGKRVVVARLSADGTLEVPRAPKGGRLPTAAEAPEIAFDAEGRLWLAARVPRGQHLGWDVHLWVHRGDRWSADWHLSHRTGLGGRPALLTFPGGVHVGYQSDDLPRRWNSVAESTQGESRIVLSSLRPPSLPPAPPGLMPYREPVAPFPPARVRRELREERAGWTVEHTSGPLRLFFGDLHEHSSTSVCHRTNDESQAHSFQMMRDLARFDFGALTDHDYNFNAYLWNRQKKLTRANADLGRFLTLVGQEWTSSFETPTAEYPNGYYGHRNLIYADPDPDLWFNAQDGTTPREVWRVLTAKGMGFVHIPHQLADTGNVPVDWSFHDEHAQPVAEIYQQRGSYECATCPNAARGGLDGHFLQDAWARGLVIGVVAAPDHAGGAGKTGVYARALTRDAIIEALRSRHTYGTTGARILLDVRVNGLLMGSVGSEADGPVQIVVRAQGTAPVQLIEVLRNNVPVLTESVGTEAVELTLTDEAPLDGPAWYYVRVTQSDGQLAWSSPVWLGRPSVRIPGQG